MPDRLSTTHFVGAIYKPLILHMAYGNGTRTEYSNDVAWRSARIDFGICDAICD